MGRKRHDFLSGISFYRRWRHPQVGLIGSKGGTSAFSAGMTLSRPLGQNLSATVASVNLSFMYTQCEGSRRDFVKFMGNFGISFVRLPCKSCCYLSICDLFLYVLYSAVCEEVALCKISMEKGV